MTTIQFINHMHILYYSMHMYISHTCKNTVHVIMHALLINLTKYQQPILTNLYNHVWIRHNSIVVLQLK